jgi:hypothetical protein
VTTRLPRVAVIGLQFPQHEWDIKEEFGKWLDIRTINVDASTKTTRKMVANVEHILLMKDYINHKIVHALNADKLPYEMFSGGVTRLRDRLKEIIQNYQEPLAQNEAA